MARGDSPDRRDGRRWYPAGWKTTADGTFLLVCCDEGSTPIDGIAKLDCSGSRLRVRCVLDSEKRVLDRAPVWVDPPWKREV